MSAHCCIKLDLFINILMKLLKFSWQFSRETLNYQISWKSVNWKPRCSIRTEGQTGMTKLTERFPQFCEEAQHRQRLQTFYNDLNTICQNSPNLMSSVTTLCSLPHCKLRLPKLGSCFSSGFSILYFCFSLTLRRLMSYIYGAPILDVSRSHITTQHSR